MIPSLLVDDIAAARRLARRLPSFRDFVEDALFDKRWGYYSTGAVRFGDGGHYDTFPIALSPFFGRMVIQLAFRRWRQWGRPRCFDLCEIGAGNGQLCLDSLVWLDLRARRDSLWRQFARALHYRIVEKSPALRQRQAAQLGPLAGRVAWEDADLSTRPARAAQRPFWVVIANEILDCLAHHKLVLGTDGRWRVAYVGATLAGPAFLSRRALAARLAGGPAGLQFTEVLLPLDLHPPLRRFLRRHYAEMLAGTRRRRPWTYFACPATATLICNLGRLYRRADILMIDYGGDRRFHLTAPARDRLRAGRPEDGASVFRAPGRDDITFLVDFSAAAAAAEDAGLTVAFRGPQRHLARLGGVRLSATSAETIIKRRALSWLLAVVGVGPESEQRRTALSWSTPPGWRHPRSLAEEVSDAIDEFRGRRSSVFQLLLIEKRGRRLTSETRRPAARGSAR